MNYGVIFKEGESCKWRCMVDDECRDNPEKIITAKWYDVIVASTHGSAMTLAITNELGEEQLVPHYAYGQWEGFSEIGITNPELAEERLRAHMQTRINAQKASHQHQMNILRNEMRSIKVKGYEEIPTTPI